jgi:hypothetical protein
MVRFKLHLHDAETGATIAKYFEWQVLPRIGEDVVIGFSHKVSRTNHYLEDGSLDIHLDCDDCKTTDLKSAFATDPKGWKFIDCDEECEQRIRKTARRFKKQPKV